MTEARRAEEPKERQHTLWVLVQSRIPLCLENQGEHGTSALWASVNKVN